eukprot:TRINITY_DN7983_c0_g1_i1.p1 TRINITY_DN7983_c0_g1~~TRINITY_DN7983_c0_g1_i1.p1  ORF type:complete len:592 (+),score=68.77 TRINITY_DN7983_c0_g1_i1:103-1776(+)
MLNCGDHLASDRAQWLQRERGMSLDDAQSQVIAEFPTVFQAWSHDRDASAECCRDGRCPATERKRWLAEVQALSDNVARELFMEAFIGCFMWNSHLICQDDSGRHAAGDRVKWLAEHKGMNQVDARDMVRAEFPNIFGIAPCPLSFGQRMGSAWVAKRIANTVWHPMLNCGDDLAIDRAQSLQRERGMSLEDAQLQVISEFPIVFQAWSHDWDPSVDCCRDGRLSEADAKRWLVEVQALSDDIARERVTEEFSGGFMWNPYLLCQDGSGRHEAGARVAWLMEHKGMSQAAARNTVRSEFRYIFGHCPRGFGQLRALAASRLVWADDFPIDGAPDPAKWDYDVGGDGWGNNELQHYTDRLCNVCVQDGTLRIRARREDFGGNRFTSARLVSRGRADWCRCRVEVRARLPTGLGSWPAIWMLPTGSAFGGWPCSGEIDIMEHVGHAVGTLHGTVHTQEYNHIRGTQLGGSIQVVNPEEWHLYSVEWTAAEIGFSLDGHEYYRFNCDGADKWETWPFNHPFHLVLNIAVGGTWGGQRGIDDAAFTGDGQIMEVDFVRVFQ